MTMLAIVAHMEHKIQLRRAIRLVSGLAETAPVAPNADYSNGCPTLALRRVEQRSKALRGRRPTHNM